MEGNELIEYLKSQGYKEIKEIPNKGLCGIRNFIFTVGLCYGIDEGGYVGRYCYESALQAVVALSLWDGTQHPFGNWIKHKGLGIDEPNLIK